MLNIKSDFESANSCTTKPMVMSVSEVKEYIQKLQNGDGYWEGICPASPRDDGIYIFVMEVKEAIEQMVSEGHQADFPVSPNGDPDHEAIKMAVKNFQTDKAGKKEAGIDFFTAYKEQRNMNPNFFGRLINKLSF